MATLEQHRVQQHLHATNSEDQTFCMDICDNADGCTTNLKESTERELERHWNKITDSIIGLASELAEALRIILQPTLATRLQ